MDSSSLSPLLESAEVQAFATGFPTTLAHLGVTLVLMLAGAVVYALLTPWKEIALIREGNDYADLFTLGAQQSAELPTHQPKDPR